MIPWYPDWANIGEKINYENENSDKLESTILYIMQIVFKITIHIIDNLIVY